MRLPLRSLLTGGLSFALWAVSLAAPTMLTVNFTGELIRLNPTTGESSVIGNVAIPGPNAMAMSPEGVLYVGGFTSPRTLSRVDWSNASSVQTITAAFGDIRDMAFLGSTLYGILNGSPDQLVTINTTTGATTVVGSTGDASMQALAALPNGTLYGWSVNVGLVTINPATGLATDVNPGFVGTAIQGLAFERDGRLFGVGGTGVYEINRTTGAQTDTGIDLGDSRGITLLPRSYRLMMSPPGGAGANQRFVFDTATMERTNVFGSSGGSHSMVGLPNAEVYHLSGITLIKMDAGNAAITTIGTLPASGRDLAWDGAQLYGVFSHQLHRIDKDTAASTVVGATGFINISGLAVLGNSMYAWDTTAGLLLVNKVTGAAVDVNAGIGGTTGIEDLEPLPDGTLLGFGDKLYVINPSTGAFTVRGGPWTGVVAGAGLITDNVRMISTTLAPPFTGRVITDRLGTVTNIGWNASTQIMGMTFGDDGYVYAGGTGTDRIVRLNPANGVCTDFGPLGVLNNPRGFCWHDGELYVAQSASDVLTRYDFLTNNFVNILSYPGDIFPLIRHPAGTLLSWDLSAGTPGMSRFDPATSSLTTFSNPALGPSQMACYPDGVTVGISPAGTWQTLEPMTGGLVNGVGGAQAGTMAYVGEQFTLHANPQDFVGNPKTIMLEVEFRHPGSLVAVEKRKMRMENLSTTHVGTLLRGRYDVSFKASHWLRKTLSSVLVDGGVTLTSTMINGDINNDNRIDSDDYDILVGQFGSSGPEADVDGGGTVDSDDFDILVKNFGDVGDN